MLRWICTAALFVTTCAVVASRGPLTLRRPETILSNTTRAQKDTEPYVLFLHWVSDRVPAGGSVAVRTPDFMWYLIAIGQLPEQDVWPAVAERGAVEGSPEWVACFFATLDDPRYERVAVYPPNGLLFRRVP